MDRKFLEALELDTDKVEQIIAAHGKATQKLRADNERLTAEKSALQTEFEQYRQGIEAQGEAEATQQALRRALVAAGVRNDPDVLEFLESKFDLSEIERDGDVITNWDSIVKPRMATISKWAGEVKTGGAEVATPPQNVGSTPPDPFLEGLLHKEDTKVNGDKLR